MSSTCEIREAGTKGRGLFAKRSLEEGEVVAVCGAVSLGAAEVHRIRDTALNGYLFHVGDARLLALGDVSFCNHSDEPNADVEHGHGTVVLKTTRAVAEGEELLIRYAKR